MPVETEKTRIYYLDVLKCIAMVCVCWYHFSWDLPAEYAASMTAGVWLRRYCFELAVVCVPLFFMVSGALFFASEKSAKAHLSRLLVLLLQFLFWRAVTYGALALHMALRGTSFANVTLGQWLSALFLSGGIPGIDVSHLWFIPAFLSVSLLAPLFRNAVAEFDLSHPFRSYLGWLLLLLFLYIPFRRDIAAVCLSVPALHHLPDEQPVMLNPFTDYAGMFLLFYLLGGVLHQQRERLRRLPVWKPAVLFFTGSVLLLLLWAVRSKTFGVTWDSVFHGYFSIPAVMMCVGLVALVARLDDARFKKRRALASLVETVGTNTLGVYYLQGIVGFTLLAILHRRMPVVGMAANLVKALALTVGCAYVSKLIKRVPLLGRTLR